MAYQVRTNPGFSLTAISLAVLILLLLSAHPGVAQKRNIFNRIQLIKEYDKASKLFERGNYELAFKQFKRLAMRGSARAGYMTGICYERGLGTEKDLNAAFHFFAKAADENNYGAIYQLGIYYENGIATEPDYKRAYDLYYHAATMGNVHQAMRACTLPGGGWRRLSTWLSTGTAKLRN